MSTRVAVVLVLATAIIPVSAADSLFVPGLVGRDIYHANRALRRHGLASRLEQVEVDTAIVPFFIVAAQAPDSGTEAQLGDTVVLRFNHPGMLRYWNASVVPLLGDFENTVSFYKVQMPPRPIVLEPAGYPAELTQCSFSGTADVEALVDFDGSVLATRIVNSSGYAAADSSACATALRGSFAPAEHYGRPVRVWFPLPYRFQFKEERALPGSVPRPAADIEP